MESQTRPSFTSYTEGLKPAHWDLSVFLPNGCEISQTQNYFTARLWPFWLCGRVCVCVCFKGEHRGLGPSISKIRSLKMDRKVWSEDLIQVHMQAHVCTQRCTPFPLNVAVAILQIRFDLILWSRLDSIYIYIFLVTFLLTSINNHSIYLLLKETTIKL